MATDTEAGRAQPQTSIEPPGGPFIRYSMQGRRQMYQVTSQAFGNSISQPLVSAPGYARLFRFRTAVSGGINSTTVTLTSAADAPYSVFALVQLRDAFGTPLITGAGYEVLNLIPAYSGGYGMFSAALNSNMPSWAAVSSGASSTSTAIASFAFATALPLELARGYGCISMANASLLPSLLLNMNGVSSVWTSGTGVSTNPTIEVDLDCDFYWLPEGINIAPPGLGTTRQWIVQQANPTISTTSSLLVNVPRLGGFLDTIIFELRDAAATPARQDGWPQRPRLYIDGVPIIDSRLDEWYDDIYNVFQLGANGTNNRPTGTLALSRKTSLSQIHLGLLDTLEVSISTNPGTLVQFEGMPWGSGGTSPYTMNIIAGQIIPSGTLIQGLPEA